MPDRVWSVKYIIAQTMAMRVKKSATRSVRQSVTASRAVVALAERGVAAEAAAQEKLTASYHRFLEENEPLRKDEAGRDLIRAIFGKDAISGDPVR